VLNATLYEFALTDIVPRKYVTLNELQGSFCLLFGIIYSFSHTKDCQRAGGSGDDRAVALVNARIKQRSIDLILVDRDLGWFGVCRTVALSS
jgi:hypothetical protein